MKLVIDIPEERYKDIQRIAEVQLERNHFQTAEQIIANGVPVDTSGDCISRQAAIREIDKEKPNLGSHREIADDMIENIKALHSVEPERPTAHWITDGIIDEKGDISCCCSNCLSGDVHSYGKFVPFCWACGAKMVEVKNE